jgi:hypothetical protein
MRHSYGCYVLVLAAVHQGGEAAKGPERDMRPCQHVKLLLHRPVMYAQADMA